MIEILLGIIGTLAVAAGGLFWRNRKTQERINHEQQRRRSAEAKLEAVETRQKVEQDIRRVSGNDARDELRRDWQRHRNG